MSRLLYFLRESLRGFFQAKVMAAVSIITIAVSLFIAALACIVVDNLYALYRQASDQVDLVAYLDDHHSTDTAALAALATGVRRMAGVRTAVAVDKKEGWNRFAATYGKKLLEAVDDNPLPAKIEVKLFPARKTAGAVDTIVAAIRKLDGIESVSWSPRWFERLAMLRAYLAGGAAALAVVCLLILQFIVSNTIKLTIYARRELVINMRFVGATDAYIRTPFILEGILQGVLGAGLAVVAVWSLRIAIGHLLLTGGPGWLFPAVILTGVVFGWSGSASAVRKFLV